MALTSTVKTDLYRFFAVAFDAAPGVTYMNQLAEAVNSGMTIPQIVEVFTTKTQFTSVYPTFFTNEQFATKLINTVVGDSATAAAKAEAAASVVSALALGGEWTRGKVIYQIFNNLANKAADDATWGNTAKQMANQVAYAQYYTEEMLSDSTDMATLRAVIANVTPTSSTAAADIAAALTPAAAAQTFTLTAGVNNFSGGATNDSFDASLIAGAQTWQSSDALVGAAGVDTLTATLISSVTPATMSGIEVVNATVNTAATVNLVNATGVTNVNSVNGLATTTFSGIPTSVAVSVSDTSVAHTINYSGVTGAADSATIKVAGIATGASTLTVPGIEALTLNAVTSPSVIDTLTTANATSLTATGDQALTVTAGLSATIRNVDASAKTAGGLTATMGAVANATIVGGAGNDSITISAVTGNVNANGGAGDDTFIAATNLTITDTIIGGDGTDTLSSVFASVSTAGYTTPTTRTISGIETLTVTDAVTGALTAVGIDTGITTVTMGANATNTAAAVTFNAGNSTLNIGDGTTTAAGITTSLTVAGSTGGTDNITVRNNNLSTMNAFSSAVPAAVSITATNTETLTLDTGTYTTPVAQVAAAVSVTGSTGFQTAETLVLRGGNVLTLGIVTADIIDASAMTATTGTTLTTVTGTTAQTVTGSGGNDVLVADTTLNVSVSGGAGNDTITAGTGNDTLLGGAGNDVITTAAGTDSVDGGAGDDTVNATLTAADTLIGGDGTDTLVLDVAATAANAVGVSGFETVTLVAGTQTMAAFTNNNTFTRVNVPTGTTSVTNAPAGVVTLGSAAATTAVTFALATGTGTSDALNFRAGDNLTQTAVTVNDIETLTLTNAATTTSANAATIGTLAASSLTSLTIAGLGGMIVTNPITGATGLVRVTDTHTGAGAVSLDLSASTGAVTYTGGTATGSTTLIMGNGANVVTAGTATTVGNFTVTGGTGADSITGGFGADSLAGGSGADTLIGGDGADTLSGGSGNDSISGGAGNDQLSTDSGADTIDGGTGTDVLTISAAFSDLSLDTISNVETLNMAGFGGTMTTAQHTAFTTVTNPAAITLSDAGTVAAKTNVTAYNLANGTNTFTASTTVGNNSVVGGTGSDTFNFGLAADGTTLLFTADDTVTGGAGTDTLNLTGNVALTVTLTNVSTVENIVIGNTTTNVSLTLANGNVAAAGNLTIDGSSLSTGTFTVAGALEADGSLNIIGGSAADALTGGGIADTITGGSGADVITGGAGNDTIDLTESGVSVDKVVFTGGATVAAVITANGRDIITGFGSTDTINVGALGDGTTTATGLITATAAAQGVLADDIVVIINASGAAGSLTTGSTTVLAAADFTAATLTNVAAFLSERYTTTNDAEQENVIVWNVGTTSYIYHIDTLAGGSAAIAATEIALVGVISQGAALVTGNIVYA